MNLEATWVRGEVFVLPKKTARRISGEAIVDEPEEIAEFLSEECDYERCSWDDVTERASLVIFTDTTSGEAGEDVSVHEAIDIPADKPCAVYVTFENEWKGFIWRCLNPDKQQWDVDRFEAQDFGAIQYNHPTDGAITLVHGDNMEFQNNVRHEALLFFNVNPETEESYPDDAFFERPFFFEEVLSR